MSTPPTLSPPPSWSWTEMLGGVASESRRVLAAHTRHFLALSVLTLLPLSSLLISSPSLLPHPSPSFPPHSLLRSAPHRPPTAALSLAAAALILSLAAAASISHSAHRGFFGRSVRLLPTLASLPLSLLRLLLTLLPFAALHLIPLSLLLLSLRFLPFLPHPLAYTLFALALIHLHITTSLSVPVAVLESSWGLHPLLRSAHLIRGMRRASLCLYLFFAAVIGLILWGFALGRVPVGGSWTEIVPVVGKTVFGCAATTALMLCGMVMNVVMYMYCKALHGELADEIAEEFALEYVFLPFDDRKVPHVVSVVQR